MKNRWSSEPFPRDQIIAEGIVHVEIIGSTLVIASPEALYLTHTETDGQTDGRRVFVRVAMTG